MNTSTAKQIDGWNGIYQPKSESTKVAEWLRENGLGDDADNIDEGTTFADFGKAITGRTPQGLIEVDSQQYNRHAKNGHIDSFLRDMIFDALASI